MGDWKIVGDNALGAWMWKNDQAKIPYDFIDAFEEKLVESMSQLPCMNLEFCHVISSMWIRRPFLEPILKIQFILQTKLAFKLECELFEPSERCFDEPLYASSHCDIMLWLLRQNAGIELKNPSDICVAFNLWEKKCFLACVPFLFIFRLFLWRLWSTQFSKPKTMERIISFLVRVCKWMNSFCEVPKFQF